MPQVLLSAPDEKPWSFGRHLAVALQEIGVKTRFLDFRSIPEPNDALLEAVEQDPPAVHIVWKGERYTPETLRKVASRGVYNVLWYPDGAVPAWLPPLAEASDLCCTQGHTARAKLRGHGVRGVERLAEGITPSCFEYDSISRMDVRTYGCDVVVIGTIDRSAGYGKRLKALNRLVSDGARVRWWGRKMAFRRNHPWDFLTPASRAWGGKMVEGASYAKACHCADIFLAIPRNPGNAGGLSNRAFWVTGLGTFYLSLYKKGMEEFFELGEEVAVFHNEDEMRRKVRYYLEHEEERETIAQAGQQRTLRDYTNHRAFCRLFHMIAERGGPIISTGAP
jgi:hypothetical protein